MLRKLFIPDRQRIQSQLDETVSILSQIQNLQVERKPQAELLFFWRNLCPFIMFIDSGIIYLNLTKQAIQTLLDDLRAGRPLHTPQIPTLWTVYLHLLRGLENQLYGLVQEFLQYIESNVLFLQNKEILNNSVNLHSNKQQIGRQITEQLLRMSFDLKDTNFQQSPYHATVQVTFTKFPDVDLRYPEEYELVVRPLVDQVCSDLKDRIQTIYLNFISIPLAISRNYFYVDKTQANEGWRELTYFFESRDTQK